MPWDLFCTISSNGGSPQPDEAWHYSAGWRGSGRAGFVDPGQRRDRVYESHSNHLACRPPRPVRSPA